MIGDLELNIEKNWLKIFLLFFTIYALIQYFNAKAYESCAEQCSPYAAKVIGGDCFCQKELIKHGDNHRERQWPKD